MRTLSLAAAVLAAATLPASAGPLSGLAWPSGSKDGEAALAAARGRALDVVHEHVTGNGSFPGMVSAAQGWIRKEAVQYPAFVAMFSLLPDNDKGQWSQCAAHNFDTYWKQIGTAMNVGAGHTVFVELGEEPLIGSDSHPWGLDHASDLANYKTCFRNAAAAVRSTFPGVVISWNNARRVPNHLEKDASSVAFHLADADPGVEDVYAVMYYDTFVPKGSTAAWSAAYNQVDNLGNPQGFGSWLSWVDAHGGGKKIGVSEWGVKNIGGSGTDDPTYISEMFSMFKSNAGRVAYETLQNNDDHRLFPVGPAPAASARYASVWKAG